MPDRGLYDPSQLDDLDFSGEAGLLPVVVQDVHSGEVLTLVHASREALEVTLASWRLPTRFPSDPSAESEARWPARTFRLHSLHARFDGGALLALVDAADGSPREGGESEFGTTNAVPASALNDLWERLTAKVRERSPDDRVTRLLEDPVLRLESVRDGAARLIAALAEGNSRDSVRESSDLLRDILLGLLCLGATLDDLMKALKEGS